MASHGLPASALLPPPLVLVVVLLLPVLALVEELVLWDA
jgi:hypothetical protein